MKYWIRIKELTGLAPTRTVWFRTIDERFEFAQVRDVVAFGQIGGVR
jgi:hypothetical protein